jgi:hypothetical protein
MRLLIVAHIFMKNKIGLLWISVTAVVALAPLVSFAGVNKINNLNAGSQFLATSSATKTMHMKIANVGTDTHLFSWDGTPWRVDQGGTGATAFSNGSIIFVSNGVFAQSNSHFFWDAINNALGIGTSAPKHALDIIGSFYSRLVTLTDSSTLTVDWNAGNTQSLTLSTSNSALTFANGQAGADYKLILKQDGTGGRTVSWPAAVQWPGGVAPTLTISANSADVVNFIYDGTHYLGSFAANYFTPSCCGSIAFDAASSNYTNSPGTSITTSHTVSGSNRILFVSVTLRQNCGDCVGDLLTGVTYNGTPMTQVGKVATHPGTADPIETYLYYLIAPATGTHNIVASYSALGGVADDVQVASASYTGGSQLGLDASAVSADNLIQSSISGTVTTATDNDWVVMGSYSGDGNTSAGSGTTIRATSPTLDRQVLSDHGGAKSPPGSVTLTVNNNNDRVGSITAAFAPAP